MGGAKGPRKAGDDQSAALDNEPIFKEQGQRQASQCRDGGS